MKQLKLIYLLFFIIIMYACKESTDLNKTIISGFIKNSKIDSLILYDKDYKPIKTIHLKKDNTFIDTVVIPKGYYFIGDMRILTEMFLKPEDKLSITINYNENIPKYSFLGIGAKENNYLQRKRLYNKKFKNITNYKYFLNLSESDFLKLADSINITKIDFLKSQVNLDKDFKFYELFVVENENASLLNQYRRWRGEFLKNKDFKVSENYPNPYKNINVSNKKLLEHPKYMQCIKDFISYKMENVNSKDETLTTLEIIDKEIKNQKVKDELTFEIIKSAISQTKMLDEVYTKFNSIEKNHLYKNEIRKMYLKLKKISKGTTSPMFELHDINDKLFRIRDLNGKLIYIDIWATWCIPCVREIPALKKLEEDLKNRDIYFVSICTSDTKERFKKMVKERKLGGIQLFAPDDDIPFFKEYFLNEIPRYILIDKEGKIIDANAYKPSNPKLKELILKNLN
ncbi:TlpA disulfide reductase family protein [Lutibacter sp.]|uniref:TlpA family protein disulfide reductase n=1 Tax=Lutibacter sp. TaxID=1925666 RepID=UPI0025C62165|nr:TlpA disulfide reductase family protein [Lutibacter sp.]MCF6181067.1 TlpA family protein disulfide reductase [Lutibacter sp.]